MNKLKIGDKAPDFTAKAVIGDKVKEIKLSDFKGKKVILYFYPKDNTPGCTMQACNLRDNYITLKNKNYEVIGVSADNEKSHFKFITKHKLPFYLLLDTDKNVINKYGVWGQKKFLGKTYNGIIRTTFIIDEDGNIEKIIDNVKTKDHTNQIINS